jgi:hypothetical protein
MNQTPNDAARAVRGGPTEIAAWIKSKGKAFDPAIVDATRDLYRGVQRGQRYFFHQVNSR